MFTGPEPTKGNSGNHKLKVNINKTSDTKTESTKKASEKPKSMDFARPEPHKTVTPKSTSAMQATVKSAHTNEHQVQRTKQAENTKHTEYTRQTQPTKQVQDSRHQTTRTASKKSAKNNQNILFIVCGAVAILAVALIVWGVVSFMNKGTISEDTTFATNDNQTTITIEPTDSESSSVSHTRTVYEYDGDNVVGMKTYFEYADNEAAKTAYELIKDQPEFKGAEVVDKYIVVTADPDSFKGLTADDIRQQAEAIERFQNSRKKTEEKTEDEHHDEEQPAEESAEEPNESSE